MVFVVNIFIRSNEIYLFLWECEISFLLRFRKDVSVQTEKRVNVWKVNSQCQAEVEKPKGGDEKWRWSHDRCVAILNGTSSDKNPFIPCLNKLNEERRRNLYKQCMEESCRFVR